MKTITFYSYKGGSGRSLTVANAALYLQRLDFRVVVIDFDLEAPGMHYKFAFEPDTGRLPVVKGLVDYVFEFVTQGNLPNRISDFALPLSGGLYLIPAGNAPEASYWQKLSRINWHELFYSEKMNHGVELFFELRNKIEQELKPDFLLIDSRTGLTEMGGVATSLLAERIICLVSPSRENLEGARAVLQSVNRTRRGYKASPVEITIALSRLPEMDGAGSESKVIGDILGILNLEADTLEDTLCLQEDEAVILHSEKTLEVREALRIATGVSPEDSILLRDYLRLFASLVPQDLVASKLHTMLNKAREKIWDNPAEAVKEVEELAESFGHPDSYRELLRFYEVRNIKGTPVLRRAQRLWEITRDSHDEILWKAVVGNFVGDSRSLRRRDGELFEPRKDFLTAVWRDAGMKDVDFGVKLADSYIQADDIIASIGVLEEIVESGKARADVVSMCIARLTKVGRTSEARLLIERFHDEYGIDPGFVSQWGNFALTTRDLEYTKVLTSPPYIDLLGRASSTFVPIRLLIAAERRLEARDLAERLLARAKRDPEILYRYRDNLQEVVEAFAALDLGEELLQASEGILPRDDIERIIRRVRRS